MKNKRLFRMRGGQACARSCNHVLPIHWLPLTNCDIAELVGSNPQTISPIIAKFCKLRLIAHGRGRLEILNPRGLHERAHAIPAENLL